MRSQIQWRVYSSYILILYGAMFDFAKVAENGILR